MFHNQCLLYPGIALVPCLCKYPSLWFWLRKENTVFNHLAGDSVTDVKEEICGLRIVLEEHQKLQGAMKKNIHICLLLLR